MAPPDAELLTGRLGLLLCEVAPSVSAVALDVAPRL